MSLVALNYIQCFDLRNFLELNRNVTGGRWRCQACESFLSTEDLELCELTTDMLSEFKKEHSTERDEVELSADGSYRLKPSSVRGSRTAVSANSHLRSTTRTVDAVINDDAIDLL